MSIKIDYREKELIEHIEKLVENEKIFHELSIETTNLLIGDIEIEGIDKEHSIIIERKTVRDLSASIKDGRYKEQSMRLASSGYHNHNIVYLLEGSLTNPMGFKGTLVDTQSLYGSIISLSLLKGFSIYRSGSVMDTANYVCNVARKLKKTSVSMYYKNTSTEKDLENTIEIPDTPPPKYEEAIKIQKKDNVTRENIGHIMLCQIPGVSNTTASAIIKKYGTMSELIHQINTEECDLQKLTYTSSNGKSRKISKSVCEKIIVFLKK